MYKAEWRKGYGQLGNIDSSFLAVGYKRGRLLGREKRRRRRRKKGVKPPVGRKEKAGSYHASISEIDFPVRQCLVSLLVSFLFSAAPLPPPRCDTTIADTCTECLPPLFKDRFLPFVFSRPKITPKVILLSPRKRTVSINWWKKLNIGEDIERREEFLHNGTSSTQSSISSRRFRKFFQ